MCKDLFYRRDEKVAACKVKPYKLVERDQGDKGGEDTDQGDKDIEKKS